MTEELNLSNAVIINRQQQVNPGDVKFAFMGSSRKAKLVSCGQLYCKVGTTDEQAELIAKEELEKSGFTDWNILTRMNNPDLALERFKHFISVLDKEEVRIRTERLEKIALDSEMDIEKEFNKNNSSYIIRRKGDLNIENSGS